MADVMSTLERAGQSRQAISALMEVALAPGSLTELLDQGLAIVLSIPWLTIEAKGCVFLADETNGCLRLTAERGLHPDLLTLCREVAPGVCLCGQAAVSREVVFADHLDARHGVYFPDMRDHGHYCVPILSQGRLLGVLNTYVAAGHPWNGEEAEFLQTMANIMAGIIERKRMEEQLQRHNAELAAQLGERTQQLIHADRLTTLGTLAAGIAHEINNPTSFISGNLDFLKMFWAVAKPVLARHADEDESRRLGRFLGQIDETLQDMTEGARRIANLVDGIKGHAKGGDHERRACLLREPVGDALRLLEHRLKKGGTVHNEVGPEVRLVGDRQQLSQVFINLLGNALDAMDEAGMGAGERWIGITAAPDSGHLVVRVADNGPGIPAPVASRIFDPFYTTKGKTVGTGLGLFIVRGIIENHGGAIALDSNPRQGACFRITLPAAC